MAATKNKQRKIILHSNGIIKCGQYYANKEYNVNENEALRLIKAKGFTEIKK